MALGLCWTVPPVPWHEGASAHRGTVLAVLPRCLQGGDVYQGGPGHDPATASTICPDGSDNMLDPDSWPMSLALASSQEVSFQTGQLADSQALDYLVRPADAGVAVCMAAFVEPHPSGGSMRLCTRCGGRMGLWGHRSGRARAPNASPVCMVRPRASVPGMLTLPTDIPGHIVKIKCARDKQQDREERVTVQ